MPARLSPIRTAAQDVVLTAELSVETLGEGFTEITADAARFLRDGDCSDGALFAFLRHTSASLTIQENADPDVQRDLVTALRRLAPQDVGWVHDTEGLDDMPAHVRTMLSGVSLHIPVAASRMLLGTWQGLYLVEHRAAPHRRTVIFQFLGTRK